MDAEEDYSILVGRMSVNVKLARRRKAQRSTGSTTVQNGTKSDGRFQRFSESWKQTARTSKKEWKWQRGIVEHPLTESQWNRDHFSFRKWSLRSTRAWGMPAEGFKGHVAIDGSLLGNAGQVESMLLGSGTDGLR